MLYGTFVWVPHHAQAKYDMRQDYDSTFPARAALLGTFYHTHGGDDDGPIALSAIGWRELVENVVKIELVYNPDAEIAARRVQAGR